MNNPKEHDAVLGGTNQNTDVVLGGIEGARQRFHQATNLRDRAKALLDVQKYDPAEGERLSKQLVRLNIAIDPDRLQETQAAIAKATQDLATAFGSPELLEPVNCCGDKPTQLVTNQKNWLKHTGY